MGAGILAGVAAVAKRRFRIIHWLLLPLVLGGGVC